MPEPQLIKVGFFDGKAAREKNQRILADHADRINAQKRFIEQVDIEAWEKEIKVRKELSAIGANMVEEIRLNRRKY